MPATRPSSVRPRTFSRTPVIFGAGPRAVREVDVDGRPVVRDGRCLEWEAIREGYEQALGALGM